MPDSSKVQSIPEAVAVLTIESVAAPPSNCKSASRLSISLAYLTCASIWGTTWYAIRLCIEPGAYPSFVAAALRFTFASMILGVIAVFCRLKFAELKLKALAWIAASGLLSGIAYGFLYVAEEQLTGGLTAVISATGPLMATLIAMRSGTEKATGGNIIGCLVALAGIALVFHDRLQVSSTQAWAVGILLLVAFIQAGSNVILKHHSSNTHVVVSNMMFFAAASIMLWGLSAATGHATYPPHIALTATLALLYLTVFGSLIAFACFFYLLKHVRLSSAMTLAFVTPLIALIIDCFFEKHASLSIESCIGIGVVLIGVATTVLLKSRA